MFCFVFFGGALFFVCFGFLNRTKILHAGDHPQKFSPWHNLNQNAALALWFFQRQGWTSKVRHIVNSSYPKCGSSSLPFLSYAFPPSFISTGTYLIHHAGESVLWLRLENHHKKKLQTTPFFPSSKHSWDFKTSRLYGRLLERELHQWGTRTLITSVQIQ